MRVSGRLRQTLVLCLVGFLYALALNPWYLPDTYDNTVYHLAGKAIAEGEGYVFGGKMVTGWPPGFPFLLAGLHMAGLSQVIVAKALVVAFAMVSLVLLFRLLEGEGEGRSLLVVALVALSPTGFQMGTRIMAEWPYMAFSFAFLLALRQLRTYRTFGSSVLAGLLLGLSTLVRYTGLFLFPAVVWQGAEAWRLKKGKKGECCGVRGALYEGIVATVGALVSSLWFLFVAKAHLEGGPSGNFDLGTYGHFHLWEAATATSNLFFLSHAVFGQLAWLEILLVCLSSILWIAGLAVRAKKGLFGPQDFYTLALIGFTCIYEEGHVPSLTRYLLPVSPFICLWLLDGASVAIQVLGGSLQSRWIRRNLAILWVTAFLAVDVRLIVVGKPQGLHGGLSPLASPTPYDFYKGEWYDLFRACIAVNERAGPGLVAQWPNSTGYVAAFTGRKMVEVSQGAPDSPVVFKDVVAIVARVPYETRSKWLRGFEEVAEYGVYHVLLRKTGGREAPDCSHGEGESGGL